MFESGQTFTVIAELQTQTKHLTKQAVVSRTLSACSRNRTTRSVPSGLCMFYLVRVHQPGMWEVEWRNEQTYTLTLHPVTIQVICNYSSHKVLAGAGPAVEGEGEWLVGLWVVNQTLDSFQNHRLSQVLPVKLYLKVLCQTCTCAQKKVKAYKLQS